MVEKIAIKPRRSLCKVAKSCLKPPSFILHKKSSVSVMATSGDHIHVARNIVWSRTWKKKTTKRNLFYCNDKIVFVRDDDLPKRRRDRFIPYCETKIFLNFWENGRNSKWKKRKAERSILFGRFCDKVIRTGNREICAVSTGKTLRLIMMRESWHTVHDHTWQECRTLQKV